MLEVVKKLLEAGATIDDRNKDGRTALMEAIDVGSEDVVLALIEAGADIKARDNNDNTALTLAAKKFNYNKEFRKTSRFKNRMQKAFELLLHLDNEEVDEEGFVINASSKKTMKKLCSIFNNISDDKDDSFNP